MAYLDPNFKNKKAANDAIKAGQRVTVFNPGLGDPIPAKGTVFVEGPHFPEPHRWYGDAVIEDGRVIKVK